MRILSAGKQIGLTIKTAARLRTIVAVLARHGFANIAERAQLGRFILEKLAKDDRIETKSAAERLREAFESLGPTFIKLGQLLATRPDLVPQNFVDEFKKLHDRVRPISRQEVFAVLANEYGNTDNIFEHIDVEPLASASIAQVHRARLKTGQEVVVKVQRPGIIETINDDLTVLYFIANLLDRYIPELRVFNPTGIVDEFFKTLDLETNFIIEANNILRFQKNFSHDPFVKIPTVYLEYTTQHVLVMEALNGIPLSQAEKLKASGIDAEVFVKKGMKIFFRMVFQDKFFHGDLHAGNLFIMPENKLGLVDFGVVGRLTDKIRDAIADMFVALAHEDYERLAYQYLELAPYNEKTDVDQLARDLRDLIAPYFGLSFKNVNTGRVLMDSTNLAARHGVAVPRDLMLFFKSIVTIEGMGRAIVEDFDVMSSILEIADDIVKARYDPNRFVKELTYIAKDSASLLGGLPRQIKQLSRKLNSPNYRWRLEIEEINGVSEAIRSSSHRQMLATLAGASAIAGSLALNFSEGHFVLGIPVISAIGYSFTLLFGAAALFKR